MKPDGTAFTEQEITDLLEEKRLVATSEVSLGRAWVAQKMLHIATGPMISDGQTIWQYNVDKGIWEAWDDTEAIARIETDLEGQIVKDKVLRLSDKNARGIHACALRHPRIWYPQFFDSARPGIACTSGFVEVTSEGITEADHSPAHRVRWRADIALELDADYTPWTEFLVNNLFRDDADKEEKAALLQEYVGCSLCGIATSYAKALVLTGAGANGKSTLLDILDALFPAGSIANIEPQRWDNPVYVAELKGALLNRSSELPEGRIAAGATFKAVISGDEIQAKRLYRDPCKFHPIAGHLFACNTLPASSDTTKGFWRRLLVLEFNRDYTLDPNRTTSAEVVTRLLVHKEAIFLWALEGAVRVLRQGKYTIPPSTRAALTAWRMENDPVYAFIQEHKLMPWRGHGEYSEISVAELRKAIVDWSYSAGVPISLSNVALGRRLKGLRFPNSRRASGMCYLFEADTKWRNILKRRVQ